MGWKEQKAIALLAIAILGTTLGSVPAYAQGEDTTYTVTVAAGDIDRQNTVISFPLPSTLSGGAYHLEGPSGRDCASGGRPDRVVCA